jgi:hypothetical protein
MKIFDFLNVGKNRTARAWSEAMSHGYTRMNANERQRERTAESHCGVANRQQV